MALDVSGYFAPGPSRAGSASQREHTAGPGEVAGGSLRCGHEDPHRRATAREADLVGRCRRGAERHPLQALPLPEAILPLEIHVLPCEGVGAADLAKEGHDPAARRLPDEPD